MLERFLVPRRDVRDDVPDPRISAFEESERALNHCPPRNLNVKHDYLQELIERKPLALVQK